MKYFLAAAAVLVIAFFVFSITHPKPGRENWSVAPEVASSTIKGKISFVARPDGVDHIYLMNPDGTGVVEITGGASRDETPEWSFDGTRLVFQRDEDGNAVYVVNAGGTGLKRLSPARGRDFLPAFSPDGTKIAFTHIIKPNQGPPSAVTSIMVMNTDGTGTKTLWDDGSFNMEPRYSPDGKTIAFMCGNAGEGVGVCTINADGSGYKKLVFEKGKVYGDPHWSHDGAKIALGSNRTGTVNIFVVNADGTGLMQLTHFSGGEEAGDVGWSLDDTKMAFEWDKDGKSQSDPAAHAEVWIMNADGTDAHSTGVSCSGVGCAPRFQPTQ